MTSKAKLQNDGERMVPELHRGTLIYGEHLIRYQAAQELCSGKIVLDIASGSGYGTKLLAEKAEKVYGVDVNEGAIKYSQEMFAAENIEYKLGDGENIPLPDNSVDVVVTFETIEHVANYKKFMDEIKRVLKKDGLAIISTPNDLEFAEGNHFHLHEFQYDELINLIQKSFTNTKSYFQATWKYVALAEQESFEKDGLFSAGTHNLAPLNPNKYLYFFVLCSNRKIEETIKPLAALGAHYSDREQANTINSYQAIIDKLNKDLEHNQKTITELKILTSNLKQELMNIKSSKSYRLANKVGKLKSRLKN